MFMMTITRPPFTYTTFYCLFYIQFHYRKTALCHLMLKTTDFSWSFSFHAFSFLLLAGFLMFLSSYYFILFFYSCSATTTRTTTIITSNNVNKGEGTPIKPTMIAIASFYKPKLPISLTCLQSTRRASTH
jgi:hypothetical protein